MIISTAINLNVSGDILRACTIADNANVKILKSKATYTFKGGLTFEIKTGVDISYFNTIISMFIT